MKQRNVFLLAAIAALMFTFSLGVLVSRPAQAQTLVSAQYMGFPRQSDIFQIEVNPHNIATFDTDQGQLLAFPFQVAADHRGRLPVVTQTHLNQWNGESRGAVCRLEDDGLYHDVVSGFTGGPGGGSITVTTFNPGVILRPGQYIVLVPDCEASRHFVAVSGYWALP